MSIQPIQKALEHLEERKEYILSMESTTEWVYNLMNTEFANFGKIKLHYSKNYINIGYEFGQLNGVLLYVQVDKYSQITPLLKRLAEFDWHLSGKPEPYEEIGRMSWVLKHKDHTFPIIISAFFNSESATACKWEKETVFEEVTKYKIVCPDDAIPNDNFVGEK